ncbi:hypothetical protein AB0I91_01895 [Actinosynnema sp. NPDC049800]
MTALAHDVRIGRVFARACAAEWTRLWTVRATWWFLAAAAVTMVGIATIAGLEAASNPIRRRAGRRGRRRPSPVCRVSSRCSRSPSPR